MGTEDSLHERIRKFLTRYHITPQADGTSPSELYLHRQIRTGLDILKPMQKGPSSGTTTKKVRQLSKGDTIYAKFMENSTFFLPFFES